MHDEEVSGGKPYGFARQAIKFTGMTTTQYQISRDTSGRPVIAFPSSTLLMDYEIARNRVERNMHIRTKAEAIEVRQKEQIRYGAQPMGQSLVGCDQLDGFLTSGPEVEPPPW